MDLFIHYAIWRHKGGIRRCSVVITPENSEQIGVTVGTVGLGGLPSIERYHKVYWNGDRAEYTPFFIPIYCQFSLRT